MQANSEQTNDEVRGRTSLAAGVIPLAPGRKRWTLPSGAVADIMPGVGRHLRLAARVIPDGSDAITYEFGLISVKTLYNGRPLTIEELDELPEDDVSTMLAAVRNRLPCDEDARAEEAARAAARDAAPKADAAAAPPPPDAGS